MRSLCFGFCEHDVVRRSIRVRVWARPAWLFCSCDPLPVVLRILDFRVVAKNVKSNLGGSGRFAVRHWWEFSLHFHLLRTDLLPQPSVGFA